MFHAPSVLPVRFYQLLVFLIRAKFQQLETHQAFMVNKLSTHYGHATAWQNLLLPYVESQRAGKQYFHRHNHRMENIPSAIVQIGSMKIQLQELASNDR